MKITLVPALLFCWILFSSNASAYCVYNKSANKNTMFRQTQFNINTLKDALFSSSIMTPGGKECCSYTNPDCCNSRNKDELLMMEVYVSVMVYHRITFPAGGWIEVADDPNNADNFIISVFNADGSVFEPSYLD